MDVQGSEAMAFVAGTKKRRAEATVKKMVENCIVVDEVNRWKRWVCKL